MNTNNTELLGFKTGFVYEKVRKDDRKDDKLPRKKKEEAPGK